MRMGRGRSTTRRRASGADPQSTPAAEALEARRLLAAGDLDPTFGTGGHVRTDLGTAYDTAYDVATQPDGKILVGGWGGHRLVVARYLPDGSPDYAFGGGGGVVKLPSATGNTNASGPAAMALQPDGKVLLAGTTLGSNWALTVYRLNPTGSLDTTFGTNGSVTLPSAYRAEALLPLPGGGFALAGTANGPDVFVARFTPGGAPDPTFGPGGADGDGIVTTDFGYTYNEVATGIVAQGDGKLVVAGHANRGATSLDPPGILLARYNPDGSLDPTFGAGGKFTPPPANPASAWGEEIHALALLPDGRLLAGGNAGTSDFGLFRFTADGAFDPTFAGGGRVVTRVHPSNEFASALAVRSDGRIYLAGSANTSGFKYAVARYTPDGVLDPTFAGDGTVVVESVAGDVDYCEAIALTADNKILLAGQIGNANVSGDWGVVRLLDDAPAPVGSVVGRVYDDRDADGPAGGLTPGLGGWRVYADANDNGQFDPGETNTLSAADGAYRLGPLPAGTHRLRAVTQDGWHATSPASGAVEVTVAQGQTAAGPDFGFFKFGVIAGRVFDDANNTLALEDHEAGLAGFTVYLDADDDGEPDPGERTAPTDGDGRYSFGQLSYGGHRVRVVPQAGWYNVLSAANVFVASGSVFGDVDWAQLRRGVVFGHVFDDTAGDGGYDPGEGLAGWTVYADLNGDGAHQPADEPSAPTGSGGSYYLGNVPAGVHTVRQIPRPGYRLTVPASGSHAVSVVEGQLRGVFDFGNARLGVVSGAVFHDRNADGTRTATDPGLGGALVYADLDGDAAHDAGEPAAQPDPATGQYSLPLEAGSYTIRAAFPPGYLSSAPAAGTYAVDVTDGAVLGGRDFGGYTTGRASGVVFEDRDRDFTRDANEPALAGRTVFVDLDRDRVLDEGEPSAVTPADGSFAFDLLPGGYNLHQVLPDGWQQTLPGDRGAPWGVTVASGANAAHLAFGSHPPLGRITGVVFHDADADGVRDDGEAGLVDRKLYIDLDNDNVRDANEPGAESGPDGAYAFEDLYPGTYTVRQVLLQGWVATVPLPAAPASSSAPRAGHSVTVGAGQTVPDVLFGTVPFGAVGSIGGTAYDDANENGRRDQEATLPPPAVTVYLDADDNGALDPGERSTTVQPMPGAAGGYSFDPVLPGRYVVRAIAPEGWRLTAPAFGEPHVVDVRGGSRYFGRDFGLVRLPVEAALPAFYDATVRDGANYENGNFGTLPALEVQQSPDDWQTRETYLRFDLRGAPSVQAATLRLFGRAAQGSSEAIDVAAYGTTSTNPSWTETGITWNTKPAAGAAPLAAQTVSGTDGRWYEWDVTEYLRQRKMAGAAFVTLALKATAAGPLVSFDSDESPDPATRPQLVLNGGGADRAGPVVTHVHMGGGAWSGGFLTYLRANSLGSLTRGFAVPPFAFASSAQPPRLPWANIDTITLRFSEDVTVEQGDLEVIGVNAPAYAVRDFRYDPATFAATWRLAAPLPADKLLLNLRAGTAADDAGNAGAAFAQRVDVLPGDVNRDAVVNTADWLLIRNRMGRGTANLGSAAAKPPNNYTIYHDVDGNGVINGSDLLAARRHMGVALPTSSPVAPAGGTPGLFAAARVRLARLNDEREPTILS